MQLLRAHHYPQAEFQGIFSTRGEICRILSMNRQADSQTIFRIRAHLPNEFEHNSFVRPNCVVFAKC